MSADSYWPEPSSDGYCAWCRAPLTGGEILTHEMETAAWEQGETLYAPEHPGLVRGDAPIASCEACRKSMKINYDQWVDQQTTGSIYDRISNAVYVVIFTISCLAIVLMMFGLI